MTINPADLAATLTIAAAIPVLGWFLSANMAWNKAVRKQNPEVFVDPIAEPVKWIQTAPRRLMESPKDWQRGNADLEALRVRMIRRLRASFLLLAFLVVLIAPASRIGLSLAGTIPDEGWFAVARLAAWAAVVGYFSFRLSMAAYRYGNGEQVSRTQFAMSIVGIVGTLAISGLMSSS
jgi:hypothetical protein